MRPPFLPAPLRVPVVLRVLSLFKLTMFSSASLVVLSVASAAFAQTYSATYDPNNTPDKSEAGQSGTNQCGNGNNQNSMCQNVYGPSHRCLTILPRAGVPA